MGCEVWVGERVERMEWDGMSVEVWIYDGVRMGCSCWVGLVSADAISVTCVTQTLFSFSIYLDSSPRA